MIIKGWNYNPLPEIVKILPKDKSQVNEQHLNIIQKEMFKAGIIPESEKDVDIILKLLVELNIL